MFCGKCQLREEKMGKEEGISEKDTDLQAQETRTSLLAIMSVVFGISGPFLLGAMWIVSFLSFHNLIISGPYTITLFSCGLAWILGLVLGTKSLTQIENSQGQLVGKVYAIVGISVSAVWMLLILAGLLLPALYYINS